MTSEQLIDRRCTNCGKSVDDLPYEFWLLHTCRSCAAEPTHRYEYSGTERKWRYFPRWHMTRHPNLPEQKRARWGATA